MNGGGHVDGVDDNDYDGIFRWRFNSDGDDHGGDDDDDVGDADDGDDADDDDDDDVGYDYDVD